VLDDLVKLKADMEEYRRAALRFANLHPDSADTASHALSQVRGPLWNDVAARGALLAERAVKLCEGIASLKDHSGVVANK
jgi:hypothetical protein